MSSLLDDVVYPVVGARRVCFPAGLQGVAKRLDEAERVARNREASRLYQERMRARRLAGRGI